MDLNSNLLNEAGEPSRAWPDWYGPATPGQRDTMLVTMPWLRQTSATLMPGCSGPKTTASFSLSAKLRRFERPSRVRSPSRPAVKSFSGERSIIVVDARHMRVSLSTMRNKTDQNDARGITQMMRLGWYRAVHVRNIDMQKMRSFLANRKLPQAQADRHRKSRSWHAASVRRADGSRWSCGLRSTRPGAPRA